MTASVEEFEAAAKIVNNLKAKPTDEELLELYALYKQANFGDNDTAKPWMVDLKGKAKWESWNKKKGMDKQTAMDEYVKLKDKLVEKYGLKEEVSSSTSRDL